MKRGQVHRPTYYKTKDFTVPGTRVRMSSKRLFLQCFQTVPQHREARIDAVYFCPSPGNLCFRNVFEGFPITVVGRVFLLRRRRGIPLDLLEMHWFSNVFATVPKGLGRKTRRGGAPCFSAHGQKPLFLQRF